MKDLPSKDLQGLWQDIVSRTAPRLPEGSVELWLASCMPVNLDNGELVVDVANVFVKEELTRRNFLTELNKAARETGEVSVIRLSLSETSGESLEKQEAWRKRAEEAPENYNRTRRLNLNVGYTFESFVVGKSNRLAHAASLAVAETPGKAYNPLFIWGGVGLGKTHLMHAICHHALREKNDLNAVYVSSEKFINEFIHAIRTHEGDRFKEKYRGVDMLLIDDIQFLGDKQASQEEFFYTFNSLRDINKQIVICSDRPPQELRNIEERLVSRFSWGLVIDIQPPDIETRIAILQKKARLQNYHMPEETINFLAQGIPSNIRELEGALNRVIASSKLTEEPPTIENTSAWLKDVLKVNAKSPNTINGIQAVVAETFGMSVQDLTSSKRTAEIALARQVAMYLCRELTGSSLQSIGEAFNKKDHTTVIHAYKKVAQIIKDNNETKEVVDNIRNKL